MSLQIANQAPKFEKTAAPKPASSHQNAKEAKKLVSTRNFLTQKREVVYLEPSVKVARASLKLKPIASVVRRTLGQAKKVLMNIEHNKLTVDVICSAAKPWSADPELVRPLGIAPFFVMEQTARAGP